MRRCRWGAALCAHTQRYGRHAEALLSCSVRTSRLASALPRLSSPRVRQFWSELVERLKETNERGLQKQTEKRDAIRDELRSLSTRQLQILMSNRKPPDVATPLNLIDPDESLDFLPASTPCRAINLLKEHVLLPQLFHGRLTLLHISFNAHAFQLGQKWIEAAQSSTWPPPPTPTPPTPAGPTSAPPSTPSSTPSPSPPLQVYQMSLIKNSLIRRWFGPQALTSLQSSTAPSIHPFVLCVLDDASMSALESREDVLGLAKQEMLGYLFLVDGQARVRWRAWGEMVGDEAAVMRRVIDGLRDEATATERVGAKELARAAQGTEQREKVGTYDWRKQAATRVQQAGSGAFASPTKDAGDGDEEEMRQLGGARAILASVPPASRKS